MSTSCAGMCAFYSKLTEVGRGPGSAELPFCFTELNPRDLGLCSRPRRAGRGSRELSGVGGVGTPWVLGTWQLKAQVEKQTSRLRLTFPAPGSGPRRGQRAFQVVFVSWS